MRFRRPEDEFQSQVIALAKLRGWKVAHFRGVRVQRRDGSCHYQTPVQGDGKGFPDLVLVRGPGHAFRLIVVELKVGKNEPTVEQYAWLGAFQGAGVPAYVWKPADWPEIERVLA